MEIFRTIWLPRRAENLILRTRSSSVMVLHPPLQRLIARAGSHPPDMGPLVCRLTCVSGIVHGDIKPKNVLVFKENNKPAVKLADFGFSAFASSKNLTLGGTVPWMAPEVQSRRSHTLSQAKQTDMFSFGLLVLWILFREQLEENWRPTQTPSAPADSGVILTVTRRVIQRVTDWLGGSQPEVGPDIRYLMSINPIKKSGNIVRAVALQLVEDNIDDGSKWRKPLTDLLGQILQFDSFSRGDDAEFDKIERVFAGQRFVGPIWFSLCGC